MANRSDTGETSPHDDAPTVASLSVWDMASLIIGIVVGTAIFRASPTVFGQFSSSWQGIAVWGLGGLLAFSGALCYSELTSTYTGFGAEYVFLTHAYGRRMGFLFAWMQSCIIVPGSIGAMSFVFVDYFDRIIPIGPQWKVVGALAAVFCLMCLQVAGLRIGKFVLNLLTALKILALLLLIGIGLFGPRMAADSVDQNKPSELLVTEAETSEASNKADADQSGDESTPGGSFSLALILVMFAFAGWNDATTVAPEVQEPQTNVPRALLLGLGFVALLYLAVNAVYVHVLGLEGLQSSEAPAADVMSVCLGPRFAWGMSVAVMISALGAIHGTIFAGARLLNAVGRDYPAFSFWKQWNARGAPVWALMTLVALSTIVTLLAGTEWGLSCLAQIPKAFGVMSNESFNADQGFDLLVSTASPVFFFFFMMTGLALIILRYRDPGRHRPFKVPGYPVTPIVLAGIAGFMCYGGLMYVKVLMLISVPPLIIGIILSFVLKPAVVDRT
ncbi:MAG: amino acid permease [Planctomycetaceae bacterium]|nr:amino acid permease [Planctomycetaceae bacterium]MCA9029536.1 amino acid permease [Planctomycetaceae bacterium]MCA9044396.1 amino acid permease [Planctomycetaceae bacterium]MCB9950826.1 amino acid permease [Planctomycetaceae bacterium]